MKTKIVTVTTTTTFSVSIKEDELTTESLKHFSSYMFDVSREDDFFGYVALCAQYNEGIEFIEGIGKLEESWQVEVLEEDSEVEIHES